MNQTHITQKPKARHPQRHCFQQPVHCLLLHDPAAFAPHLTAAVPPPTAGLGWQPGWLTCPARCSAGCTHQGLHCSGTAGVTGDTAGTKQICYQPGKRPCQPIDHVVNTMPRVMCMWHADTGAALAQVRHSCSQPRPQQPGLQA